MNRPEDGPVTGATPRVGGRYRTRAGYLAEILSVNYDPIAVWPWRGTVEIVPGEPQPVRWMLSGRGTGQYTDDPIDLMEEIPGTIPETEWVWLGGTGHFCGSFDCRFHLTTKVGAFLVSTVGDYYPNGYEGGRKTLSSDPDMFFETMVFKIEGARCLACGLPDHNGGQLDCSRYIDCGAAQAGHLGLCRKWAAADPVQGGQVR